MRTRFAIVSLLVVTLFSAPALHAMDWSHLAKNPPRVNGVSISALDLPAKYDLRNVNGKSYITSVKNQGNEGTCWSFAACGALESAYLKNYDEFIKAERDFGDDPNLSELHLAWFTFNNPDDQKRLTFTGEDDKANPDAPPAHILNNGGYPQYVIMLASRLEAPVLDQEALAYSYKGISPDYYALPWRPEDIDDAPAMPYSGDLGLKGDSYDKLWLMPERDASPEDYGVIMRVTDAVVAADLTETYGEDANQINVVKLMLRDIGAVYAGITTARPGFRKYNNYMTYYVPEVWKKYKQGGHAVLIVGWDDNFSRENFDDRDELRPKSDGAWLVKNSWGNDWGNDGYFWLSYEEPLNGITALEVKPYDEHMRVYLHDYLGMQDNIGTSSTGWEASVFEVQGDHEKLKEISFYAMDNNAYVEAMIYDLGEVSEVTNPVSGELLLTVSDEIDFGGYCTLQVSESGINLQKGHKFSVVTKFVYEEFNKPLAVAINSDASTSHVKTKKGWSFFSDDGLNWEDGADSFAGQAGKEGQGYIACVRGFTFVPDTRRAEDWTLTQNNNEVSVSIPLLLTSEPDSNQISNLNFKGKGLEFIGTEIQKEENSSAGDSEGSFYDFTMKFNLTSTLEDAVIESINLDDVEIPSDGIKLSAMTKSESNNNFGSSSGGCNAQAGAIELFALTCVLFVVLARRR